MKTNATKKYSFRARLWLYPSEAAAWHFVTIPKAQAETIKATYGKMAKGWGSLPVEVSIGKTVWQTSIFPDRQAGTYLLPVKAAVRTREGLYEGDMVSLSVSVRG
jgi:hypothetical protein